MVKGLFTPHGILKDVISVKTMFKSVFLVNALHARTRVWTISLPVLYINVLYISVPFQLLFGAYSTATILALGTSRIAIYVLPDN